MDSIYIPSEIETKLYQHWEENHFFSPQGQGQPYSIMIPPPNVTGSLHMGHAFQHTIQDALIRLARMQGKQSLWQVGTDHAGIAVQMVVERNLAKANEPSRVELGRDAFTKKIWQWKEESGGTITRQMRRLGNSVDWDNERFTMDAGFYHAVQQVFIQLFEEGLIYRGKRLVNWDPKFHTAISDLEVENHEEKGNLWEFKYPLANGAKTQDGKDYLTIATTRPETMLGDTAVAVHPNDERYKHLIGQEVMLPLVNRLIPVIADHYVDPEFGTGCVKITPAHDFNDYQVGLRHKLPMLNIFDGSACILNQADVYNFDGSVNKTLDAHIPEAFQNLDRYDARNLVIEKFSALGLFVSSKDHLLKVPRGDRSGLVIEPMLTDQWFVDAKTLAKPAIDAVKSGAIEFKPKQYENMFFSWMNDLQDWCISRQLWWGHRIPAWYDDEGKVYVGENEQQIREKHQLGEHITLTQDEDVLDTWFSSSLWTFATLGWPENTERLKKFHPTDVLVTGFDIIFFWVARMMMMSMHFLKDENNQPQVPFKTVFITGLIRAENGQKMSKSKGNVIDPLDMIDGIDLDTLLAKRTGNLMQPKLAKQIEKQTQKEFPDGIAEHGTDALRFTLTSLASTGRDINWDMKRLEGYRNFCNKLWNASRYVLSHTENYDSSHVNTDNLSLTDRWIITKLQLCIRDVNDAFNRYRFDLVSQTLFEFIKNQYCDWYIELSKPVLFDKQSTTEQLANTRHTLITVLESILRLAHPIIPFITEAIWQKVRVPANIKGDSIMLAAYPTYDSKLIDHQAEAAIEWIKRIIIGIRNIRGELNISPAIELPVLFVNASNQDKSYLNNNIQFLKRLAKIKQVTVIENGEETPLSATQLVGQLEVLVPLAGFIDINKEKLRLQKEIDKTHKDLGRLNGKLNNEKFVANAPKVVIDKEKEKCSKANNMLKTLKEQLIKLEKS